MLTRLVQSNKSLYYKNLNIFIIRQFTSKINTNFVSISVVCIVLFLVIAIFSTGYSIQSTLSGNLKKQVPYDISFFGEEENKEYKTIYESLPLSMKSIDTMYHEYDIYRSKKDLYYKDFPINASALSFDMGKIPVDFVLLSDYNKLLEMQGEKIKDLSQQEYFIISSGELYKGIAQQFSDKEIAISLGDKTLLPKGTVQDTKLSNSDFTMVFVVNDTCLPALKKTSDKVLNMTCKSGAGSKALLENLRDYANSNAYHDRAFFYYSAKEDIYLSSLTAKAVISFLAIYLGLVFMVTCAAILAIQQLAQADDNKESYALLRKLGSEKNMLNRALFIQILFYFLSPLTLAMVHSIVGLQAANNVLKIFGHINVTNTIVVSAMSILVVYGAYFGLT